MTNPDREELVKLLVWGKSRITGEVGVMAQDAYTSIGHYISSDNGWFLQGQSRWNASASIDDAKAAAQADYEARIRSALVDVPAAKGEPEPVAWPANLNPLTLDLVQRFALALAKKLRLAEEKYGHTDGWSRDDWEAKCRDHLYQHLEKGDPRDVAAYCAFMWHHGWITYRPATTTPSDNEKIKRAVRLLDQLDRDATIGTGVSTMLRSTLGVIGQRGATPPADAGMREALERRVIDLRAANANLHELDCDIAHDRDRNSREIEWLSRVLEPDGDYPAEEPTLSEKWQAEARKALTAPGATTKSDSGYDVRFHENVLDRLGAEKIKPGPSNLNFTPISGPAMDDLERRKECDDGPSEAQVTADARCFLGLPPSEPSSDGVDTCIACDVPLVDGDMVYSDASGGCIHAACCGPERESYVGNDGEPLKDGEPIPTPWPWTADPSSTRSEVTVEEVAKAIYYAAPCPDLGGPLRWEHLKLAIKHKHATRAIALLDQFEIRRKK